MTHLCEWAADLGRPHDAACHDWASCLGLNLAIGGALEAAYTLGMYPVYWGSNVEGEQAFGGRWPWPR